MKFESHRDKGEYKWMKGNMLRIVQTKRKKERRPAYIM